MTPSSTFFFAARYPASKRRWNAHVEEDAGLFHGVKHFVSVRQRQRHGLLAKDGLPAGRGVHDHLLVGAGGGDDSHRFHILILQQVQMTGVDLDAAQFGGELFPQIGFLVGDRDQAGIGNALGEVARIEAAHPSQSDHAYIQARHAVAAP